MEIVVWKLETCLDFAVDNNNNNNNAHIYHHKATQGALIHDLSHYQLKFHSFNTHVGPLCFSPKKQTHFTEKLLRPSTNNIFPRSRNVCLLKVLWMAETSLILKLGDKDVHNWHCFILSNSWTVTSVWAFTGNATIDFAAKFETCFRCCFKIHFENDRFVCIWIWCHKCTWKF